MKKKNQYQQIIEYLNEKGNLSRFTAMVKLGVCNLPQRISELKARGYNIGVKKIPHINRNGRKIVYNEYFLIGDENNAN